MDRPLNAEDLRNLARELISHSESFEPFVPGRQRGMHEILALLGSLEKTARASIELILREQAHQAAELARAQAMQAEAAAARASIEAARASRQAAALGSLPGPGASRSLSPSISFETRNQQYRPALQDPSVVQALLSLRTKTAAQNAAAAAAGKPPAALSNRQPAPQRALPPQFSAEKIARVDTEKSYGALPRKPGVGAPILRPKPKLERD